MSIEFMTDPIREKDRRELDGVVDTVNEVPKPPKKERWEKDAVFLKKFTLALMGQYYRKPRAGTIAASAQNESLPFSHSAREFPPKSSPVRAPHHRISQFQQARIPSPPSPLSHVLIVNKEGKYVSQESIKEKPIRQEMKEQAPSQVQQQPLSPSQPHLLQQSQQFIQKKQEPARIQSMPMYPSTITPSQSQELLNLNRESSPLEGKQPEDFFEVPRP
jgi:hypothetical protein